MKVIQATHKVSDLTLSPVVGVYKSGIGLHYDLGYFKIAITGKPLKWLTKENIEDKLPDVLSRLARGRTIYMESQKGKPTVKIEKSSNSSLLVFLVPPGFHNKSPKYAVHPRQEGELNTEIIGHYSDVNHLSHETIEYPLILSKGGSFIISCECDTDTRLYAYHKGQWLIKSVPVDTSPMEDEELKKFLELDVPVETGLKLNTVPIVTEQPNEL